MPDMYITNLTVGEAMSQDFGLVDQNTQVHAVVDLMLNHHWGEVVIVDENHSFLGLVTKEHLVRIISNGLPEDTPIIDLCSRDTITTTHNEELVQARDVMRRNRIGRLPVLNHSGKVIGILTARDVCNGFSSKLELLGEHMYSVMENIAEAIQVIDCDGIVTFWNQGAERLFNIKSHEIMGKNLADFLPDDLLLKVVKTLNSYYNVLSELNNGVYVVRNAVPVVFARGDVVGAVCTSLDVTQTKQLIDKLDKTTSRVKNLERIISPREDHELFYTINPETKRVLLQAKRVAATDATVLIQGESGTGKELMANVLYKNSKRFKEPFIEINCSAIPETLFESEMFGYESGTFTGANKSGKPGKFELAAGGTLFLDEIGELPLDMQAKLLRVLQEKRFYRVGGATPISSDVRIIAATNRDLAQLVEENKFRKDLYYRLNVVVLDIPPLRERKDDVPGLSRMFIKKLAMEYDRVIDDIDQEVLDVLAAFSWPGNVRQLHNLLESVVILMEDNYISMKALEEAGVLDLLLGGEKSGQLKTISYAKGPAGAPGDRNLDELVFDHEREVIIKALEECRYNKAETAKLLGIPRSTLYYKLKALDISTDNKITNSRLV